MTREEAIAELKLFKGHTFIKTEEALDMAIEALEQEPLTDVLDKIRAEIDFISDSNGVKHIHRDDVLQIIDKYRKGDKE